MMGAVCNGCGSCCDPVILPYTQIELRQGATPYDVDPEEREWVLNDLTPMRVKEAKAKEPWLFDRSRPKLGQLGEDMAFYFSCRHFDPMTRRCTNYENRPLPCHSYPWYGARPNPFTALPPTCSFNEDIGVPVVLITKP